MTANSSQDLDTLFESVYQKLIDPEFGTNLGGELPLYIQPFSKKLQSQIAPEINRLQQRLEKKGITSVSIHLYDLCISILQEEGILDTILENEKGIDRSALVATLDSVLDVQQTLIPRIQGIIEESQAQFAFIHAIGRVYPFVRSHAILNNIDELTSHCQLIFFFPGEYNNLQLNLFGRISDENYYRGLNLADIL